MVRTTGSTAGAGWSQGTGTVAAAGPAPAAGGGRGAPAPAWPGPVGRSPRSPARRPRRPGAAPPPPPPLLRRPAAAGAGWPPPPGGSPPPPPGGVHRVAQGAQALHVVAHRAGGHLQARCQLRAGPVRTGLEQREEAQESGGRLQHPAHYASPSGTRRSSSAPAPRRGSLLGLRPDSPSGNPTLTVLVTNHRRGRRSGPAPFSAGGRRRRGGLGRRPLLLAAGRLPVARRRGARYR